MSGEIFDINNEDVLEKFLEKNERGIVFIDLVETANCHVASLSDDARQIIQVTNAGGNSEISEAISYEIFYRYRCAKLVMTENEIENHLDGGPLVDYVCEIHSKVVAVSVTRAMNKNAKDLLKRKLDGIAAATEKQKQKLHKSNEKWERLILHVWVQNEEIAKIVSEDATELLKEPRYETLVVISRGLPFIFNNDKNMLQSPKHKTSEGASSTSEARKTRKRKAQEQETPQKQSPKRQKQSPKRPKKQKTKK
ncbi:AAC-rich mRNA clone AAC4 protein-like isoform X1 [Crassostrea angulata]|uniref:AAC-rich mRNA clone AAC4 protein-like isoform X1 n=1 Tax=Magallana angulata TaxID=2784310 RepID=UPI0022B128BC|nr:AAC-rich mRNA clone AAC4 protein-like isoform X1 [Crassostrea angulata]